MDTPELKLVTDDDLAAASWIKPRLMGEFGAVTREVPQGYAAYARVCHPADDESGSPTAWSQVAAVTGRQAHPTMQWHALVGSPHRYAAAKYLWPGNDPECGNLPPQLLGPLCNLLTHHTTTPDTCYFGLWEGHGWTPSTAVANLHHYGRDYILFTGPLHAALQLGHRPLPDWFVPQSPNLLWPADRAWYVASEIDFDSTLVGGQPT
ncbi:hypothetical protein [Krasilnikovia sp. MM14-A1259]|uniref:hypothetical protein n=1 Tax=Krasilnikovia sp. MM14-A1259 TaxID=3373539 RepID=UPI00399CCE1E